MNSNDCETAPSSDPTNGLSNAEQSSTSGRSPSGPASSSPPSDLLCAICRKKTANDEVVSRCCLACGAPVHLMCAQIVAARDCQLALGFSLPSLFCSRRCFDLNAIGPDRRIVPPSGATHNEANSPSASSPFAADDQSSRKWSPHVPNDIMAALTIKVGDVTRTSRKHLSISTFRFQLAEGFEVFQAKVNSRTAKELAAFPGEPHVRVDPAIYIRPGVHSKQAELVELTDKNFETRIRKTYRNFLKRKATQSANEQFECDIYTYVRKEAAMRKRGPHVVRGEGGRG
ncbi:hypothetical protein PINS_up001308 [Pythium insidiosum]|nr:hypothetical protein PINS_up001308 [Pythium insidiosum]